MAERTLHYVRRHHLGLLAVLLALSGTAYAAAKLDSGDFENKSLKGKDFKPASIKAKQFAADTITGADVDDSTLDATRVVARLREPDNQTISRTAGLVEIAPIGSWTQGADQVDKVLGRFTIDFPAGCLGSRAVQIYLVRPGSSFPLSANGIVAAGFVQSAVAGGRTVIGTLKAGGALVLASDPDSFEPGTETTRTLDVWANASCGGGSTADPVLTDLSADVIGYR
jgi:hypothetical protein